jgi:hypothetical protein
LTGFSPAGVGLVDVAVVVLNVRGDPPLHFETLAELLGRDVAVRVQNFLVVDIVVVVFIVFVVVGVIV